jgi:redox-sensitive bicupin YhaK (pirin superfamily)
MKTIGFLILATIGLQGGEMVTVRKSEDRGHSDHGWLNANYTFSFASYQDEDHMGFRSLRVINEDTVAPTKGFDTHPHNDMEILTYIIDGAIEHKDTLGNTSRIKTGEFQIQSAGTGIEHSEYNPSKTQPVHLLQIWIQPEKKNLPPNYQQMSFADHTNGLRLIASRTDGPLKINQDAKIYLGRLPEDDKCELKLSKERHAWIQIVRGSLTLNGTTLEAGDGAAVSEEKMLSFKANEESEFLVFDLN